MTCHAPSRLTPARPSVNASADGSAAAARTGPLAAPAPNGERAQATPRSRVARVDVTRASYARTSRSLTGAAAVGHAGVGRAPAVGRARAIDGRGSIAAPAGVPGRVERPGVERRGRLLIAGPAHQRAGRVDQRHR